MACDSIKAQAKNIVTVITMRVDLSSGACSSAKRPITA